MNRMHSWNASQSVCVHPHDFCTFTPKHCIRYANASVPDRPSPIMPRQCSYLNFFLVIPKRLLLQKKTLLSPFPLILKFVQATSLLNIIKRIFQYILNLFSGDANENHIRSAKKSGRRIRSFAHRSLAHCSFAQIAQIKWALWAICSDRSGQMSNCERIAQVAHVKRVTMSESLR